MGNSSFSPKDGLSHNQANSILRDVLGHRIADLGDLDEQFLPTVKMTPGMYVSNAPAKYLGFPIVFDGRKQILVFLTDADLCILHFKEGGQLRQTDHFGCDEEHWLPARLLTPDGKSLLIDKLRGRPSKRPLPDNTIAIPR